MSIICLVGTESDVIAANAQIQVNAGIPTPDGKTLIWDTPLQNYSDPSNWFIKMPPPMGWGGYTQDEMMVNVVNVIQQEDDPSWYPPLPPIP